MYETSFELHGNQDEVREYVQCRPWQRYWTLSSIFFVDILFWHRLSIAGSSVRNIEFPSFENTLWRFKARKKPL